jgi:hypothetical protein
MHDDAETQLIELTAETAVGNTVADHVDPPSELVQAGAPDAIEEGPLSTQSPASGHESAFTNQDPAGRLTAVQLVPPSADWISKPGSRL